MRDEAETREHGDANFGLREKPEEAPPKSGNSVRDDASPLSAEEIQHRKKVRAQEAVGEQADAGRQQNAENQHAQNGIDEPGPHGQRQPGESHSLGTQVDGRDTEIERVEERRGTENGNADNPKRDSQLGRD